jgi:glucose-1-phosphate thymidylyltransferase
VYLTRDWTDGHPVLIVYGDTVFEGDLGEAIGAPGDGAIGVHRVEDPTRFGVVEEDGGRIVRLVEKPEAFVSDLAIVGINYIRNSRLLFSCLETMIQRDLRTRGELQLTDAFSLMVSQGAHLSTFPVDNWFDCGAPDTLLETNQNLLSRLPKPAPREDVILIPPVFVSESASVTRSILGPDVSVGDGAVVADAIISDSIIGEGAHVSGCSLARSLVGTNAVVESGARRLNVGDSSEVRLLV